MSPFLFPAPALCLARLPRRAVNRLQGRRRPSGAHRAGPRGAPKRPPRRYLPTCTEPCAPTNGSALYWAGSQLPRRPIGERLLVSWQSGVPAPRLSGFVWVLGGGPGCRGPRCRLASGTGSGSSGPERGEGLCVDRGPAAPPPPAGPAPFSEPAPPEPPSNATPPPRPGAAGRPRLRLTTSEPVASPLTPRTSLPALPCLGLDPSHASTPLPWTRQSVRGSSRIKELLAAARRDSTGPAFLGVLRTPVTHVFEGSFCTGSSVSRAGGWKQTLIGTEVQGR